MGRTVAWMPPVMQRDFLRGAPDSPEEVARGYGVADQRALFVIAGNGVIAWRHATRDDDFTTVVTSPSGLSRRDFIAANFFDLAQLRVDLLRLLAFAKIAVESLAGLVLSGQQSARQRHAGQNPQAGAAAQLLQALQVTVDGATVNLALSVPEPQLEALLKPAKAASGQPITV